MRARMRVRGGTWASGEGALSSRVCSLEAFPGLPTSWTLFSSASSQGDPRGPYAIQCPSSSHAVAEGTPHAASEGGMKGGRATSSVGGYLEESLADSWTPHGKGCLCAPLGWASKAEFLQPAGPRAHAVGGPAGELERSLQQSSSSRGEATAPEAMCPGAQKAEPGPGPEPATRATDWFSSVEFVS